MAEEATDSSKRHFQFAVIGGGISGVSCVEQILEFNPEAEILLVSASNVVKEVSNVTRLTKTLEDFVIVEKSLKSFKDVHGSVCVIQDTISEYLPDEHKLITSNHGDFYYHKLCICTGGRPKVVFPDNEYVIGIRDTESVQDLTKRLGQARRVLLLGNGGIATELVYELQDVDVVWSVKDKSISAHYLDAGAAEFFILGKINQNTTEMKDQSDQIAATSRKRRKYGLMDVPAEELECHIFDKKGSALGPDWHEGFSLHGASLGKKVIIEYETECIRLLTHSEYLQKMNTGLATDAEDIWECCLDYSEADDRVWPVYGELTNGKIYGCDFMISATGVEPNCEGCPARYEIGKGIFVNCRMETETKDIYAAGDVCCCNWNWSPHWFQMRLWTQARQMGLLAGKWMHLSIEQENENTERHPCDDEPDFVFEIFSHVTRFFGFKVVLLGLYNAQGLEPGSYEYLVRCTKNSEYIKIVLQNSRMKGALLIGETGLEETFENLILNQLDLSPFGEDLLNPDIDIEDYFD